MIAVRNITTGLVWGLIPDDMPHNHTERGLFCKDKRFNMPCPTMDWELVEGVTAPDLFEPNALSLVDGQWSVVNQDAYDAAVQAAEGARRAALKATRARFAIAAFSAGIITDAEAEAWAGGTALPQIVTDAFADNITDPTKRLAARIEALTTANVHRTNPLILMLQADPRINLTDEQADALFE